MKKYKTNKFLKIFFILKQKRFKINKFMNQKFKNIM